MPKYSQDAAATGFTDLTPELYDYILRTQGPDALRYPDTPGVKWWEPVLALGGVAGGAGLAGALAGGAGAGAGAAGAATAGASGLPVTAGGSLPAILGAGGGTGTATLSAAPGAAGGGFWGGLGQVFGIGGGGGPGTAAGGGTIPAIADLAGRVGRTASALQSGRAAGRKEEAEAARAYDYLNLARTRTEYDRAQAELDQRRYADESQRNAFRNTIRASLLQNARPGPTVSAPAEIAPYVGRTNGGGIGDIPQSTRDEIGGSMYRNAITDLLDPLQPGTATSGRRLAALPTPDPLSPTPSATGFDTALNYLGAGTGLLQSTRTPPTPPPPQTTNAGAAATTPSTPPPAPAPPTPGMQIYGDVFGTRSGLPSIAGLVPPVPGPNTGRYGYNFNPPPPPGTPPEDPFAFAPRYIR